MRIFLHTYESSSNFAVSAAFGVFGAARNGSTLGYKVSKLERGDFVLIRDGSKADSVVLLGAGVVVGDVFRQPLASPYKPNLWPDENAGFKYYYRIPVDFKHGPTLSRTLVEWKELDELGFTTTKGQPLTGRRRWSQRLSGNFLRPSEVREFSRLLGLQVA
jgi:hypothetical protein